MQKYPNATAKILYKYANKPCPQMRGETLRAKLFPPNPIIRTKGKKTGMSCLKWLEADLKKLERGKVGKPGQEAARAARDRPAAKGAVVLSDSALDRLVERIVAAFEDIGRKNTSDIKNEIAAMKATGLPASALQGLAETLVAAVKATGKVTASEIKTEIAEAIKGPRNDEHPTTPSWPFPSVTSRQSSLMKLAQYLWDDGRMPPRKVVEAMAHMGYTDIGTLQRTRSRLGAMIADTHQIECAPITSGEIKLIPLV